MNESGQGMSAEKLDDAEWSGFELTLPYRNDRVCSCGAFSTDCTSATSS